MSDMTHGKLQIIQAKYTASAVRKDQYPTEGLPEIAFLGRSNVGKSSLINSLCGQRGLARVSGAPGKTQTINYFNVTLQEKTDAEEPGVRLTFSSTHARLQPTPNERQPRRQLLELHFDVNTLLSSPSHCPCSFSLSLPSIGLSIRQPAGLPGWLLIC